MNSKSWQSIILVSFLVACGSDGGGTSDKKPQGGDDSADDGASDDGSGSDSGDDGDSGADDGNPGPGDDVIPGDGEGDGDGNGDGDGPVEACVPADAPSTGSFEGPKTWTEADFTTNDPACAMACDILNDFDCVEQKCAAGATDFYACQGTEEVDCLTRADGTCRKEWETEYCCVDDKCASASDEAFNGCVETNCGDVIDATSACLDKNFAACTASARALCFKAP